MKNRKLRITKQVYGRCKDDTHRYLSSNLRDDSERDSMLKDFMQWCPTSWLNIQSEQDIPQHFRDLVIKDVVTRKSISLLPDGGFQNGWYVDSSRTRGYYGISCNEDSNVPIFNRNLLKFHLELA